MTSRTCSLTIPNATSRSSDNISPASIAAEPQPLNPKTSQHEARKISTGPDLPPTPPSHSRNYSGAQAATLSNPPAVRGKQNTPLNILERPILTPPDQRRLPTPDVTPPGPALRPHTLRPYALDRHIPISALAVSSNEHFKAPRDSPTFRSQHHTSSTLPRLSDRQANLKTQKRRVADLHTSRTLQIRDQELFFQGKSENVHVSQCPERLENACMAIRKVTGFEYSRQLDHSGSRRAREHSKSIDMVTRGPRSPLPQDKPSSNLFPKRPSDLKHGSLTLSVSDLSFHTDANRLSAQSAKSFPSPIVEAVLVGLPQQVQQTLHHVKKRGTLRDVGSVERCPAIDKSVEEDEYTSSSFSQKKYETDCRLSSDFQVMQSSSTSERARKQVWKTGDIPVIVAPDLRSLGKDAFQQEPSTKITSSRRSGKIMNPDLNAPGLSTDGDTFFNHRATAAAARFAIANNIRRRLSR